jgi:hypothetical protein
MQSKAHHKRTDADAAQEHQNQGKYGRGGAGRLGLGGGSGHQVGYLALY